MRSVVGLGVFFLFVLTFLSGCPVGTGGNGPLVVQPSSLDFGLDKNELVLRIGWNGGSPSSPIVVEPLVPWLEVLSCNAAGGGCIPDSQPIDVRVRVNRQVTTLGENHGSLVVRASNAPYVMVPVRALDKIKVDFSPIPDRPSVSESVLFQNASTYLADGSTSPSWEWSFGDGAGSNEENPRHAYAAAGTYSVRLRVTLDGMTEEFTRTVEVGQPTVRVEFDASPQTVSAGGTVQFTDQSVSSNAPITAWQWEFGDGFISREQNPQHQYLNPGLYNVTLRVTTPNGTISRTKERFITVQAATGPIARFSFDPIQAYVNEAVRFTDLSVYGTAPINQWIWEFGTGALLREQNPQYTYTDSGTYEVRLTVIDANGAVARVTHPITVQYRAPEVDFAASNTSPNVGEEIQFFDLSRSGTLPNDRWIWDFGDGILSAEQNPRHRYETEGEYTVSLTVYNAQRERNTGTLTKTKFVKVVRPPVPNFSFAPVSAFTDTPVQFTNETVAGTETQLSYEWNFGDPQSPDNISTLTDPRHLFSRAGEFTVTLTVRTPTRSVTISKTVTVAAAPVPDFSATPTTATFIDAIQFRNSTSVVGTVPVLEWFWEFGDGNTSTDENPVYTYATAGQYTVRLTARFEHPLTGERFERSKTRERYITITNPTAPQASFRLDKSCAETNDVIQFTDTSRAGSRPITGWLWDFGDGNTSTAQNPTHRYTTSGTYTIRLTVTSNQLPSPYDQSVTVLENAVRVVGGTPLDNYVRQPDSSYRFEEISTFPVTQSGIRLGTAYALRMTSLAWRSAAEVYNGTEWFHNLTIVVPNTQANRTAILFVTGGSRDDDPRTADTLDPFIGQVAAATGSVVAVLENVPNQPLIFTDELDERGSPLRSRSEDEIIAYSYDKYMQSYLNGTPDSTWPALFPMVKAAVRAMDTVQVVAQLKGFAADDFIVTGASKRGWTTWLTGATDCRIRAIVPIVIDILNMPDQLMNHRMSYGFWSPAIYPYAQMKVFDKLVDAGGVTPEAESLLGLVDPYRYRNVLSLPKYLLNSSGDQFFLPNGSTFYFADLLGEKYVNYVPNTDHSMETELDLQNPTSGLSNVLAYLLAVTQNKRRPSIQWSFEEDGSIRVQVDPTASVRAVTLWQATNAEGRDFRLSTIGPAYRSTALTSIGGNVYVGRVNIPAQGWTAFYIQVRYRNEARLQISIPGVQVPDLVFSTDVRVVPEVYPEFSGKRFNTFGRIPVLVLYGDPYTMGHDYSTLMQNEITTFIPAYLAAAQAAYPSLTNTLLDNAWNRLSSLMDQRIVEEIDGIADGAGISPTILRRANMVPLFAVDGFLSVHAALFRNATQDQRALHLSSILSPLALGAQDKPVVVMYVPDQGTPHALLTFAGLSVAPVGINVAGVSFSETATPSAPRNFSSTVTRYDPWLVGRQALYEAHSLRQARVFFDGDPNNSSDGIRSLHQGWVLLNDGRWELRGAKGSLSTSNAPRFFLDNDTTADPLRPNVRLGVVTMGDTTTDALTLFNNFIGNYGQHTPSSAFTLVTNTGQALSGDNILNAVIDNTMFSVTLSYAAGSREAWQESNVTIDLQGLLP